MIIYLHGFDSNSPGNHEKVLQLQFIDPDVRLISYSTRHPKHDMQHLLKEVDKMLQLNVDDRPLICGVGLGDIGLNGLVFCVIFVRSCLILTCSRMRTWKAKLTDLRSMQTSQQNA